MPIELNDPNSADLISNAGQLLGIRFTDKSDANAVIAALPEGCTFPNVTKIDFARSNATFASFFKLLRKSPKVRAVFVDNCEALTDPCDVEDHYTSKFELAFTLPDCRQVSFLGCNLGDEENLLTVLKIVPNVEELCLNGTKFEINTVHVAISLKKLRKFILYSTIDASFLDEILSDASALEDLDLCYAAIVGDYVPRAPYPLHALKRLTARKTAMSGPFLLAILPNAHQLEQLGLIECDNLSLTTEEAATVPEKYHFPNLIELWAGPSLATPILRAMLRGSPNLNRLDLFSWVGDHEQLITAEDISLKQVGFIECRCSSLKPEHSNWLLTKAPNTQTLFPATPYSRTDVAMAWLAAPSVKIYGRDSAVKIKDDFSPEYHEADRKAKLLSCFDHNVNDLLNEVVALRLFFEHEETVTSEEQTLVFGSMQSLFSRTFTPRFTGKAAQLRPIVKEAITQFVGATGSDTELREVFKQAVAQRLRS